MKLWLLERIGETDYDEMAGYVIRAPDEAGARRMAAKSPGAEGSEPWTDPARSRCVELTTNGDAEVVLEDFRAG